MIGLLLSDHPWKALTLSFSDYLVRRKQRAQQKPKRRTERTQTTVHQPKKQGRSYEFLKYLFKFTSEENDTISNEDQNKDHDEAQQMTVYMKTISEYLFKFTNEMNSTVSNEDRYKDRGGTPRMTVYVNTISGKTTKTSVKQDTKQEGSKTKRERERRFQESRNVYEPRKNCERRDDNRRLRLKK